MNQFKRITYRYFQAITITTVNHTVMSNFLQSHGLQPAQLLCPWNSPGKSTGVGCHSFLQGIFPTQGSNLSLLHCRQILYQPSLQGSPIFKLYFLQFCLFVYVFLAVPCLRSCVGFSLVVESRGYSLVAVCGLLIAVTSLVAEHGLQVVWTSVVAAHGLSSCSSRSPEHRLNSFGAWAQLLGSMWHLFGSGIELVSPALAGGFFTTEPLGKPQAIFLS